MTKRIHKIIAALTFLVPLTVYLFTLFPTVTNEDSGELMVAADSLGIAHPPGYPLLSTFGKFFTLIIPFGNIGWRLNVMSAVFSALTVWLIYLLANKIINRHNQNQDEKLSPLSVQAISIFPAFITGFSVYFGAQAMRYESYPLNSFFTLILIHLTYQWHLNPSRAKLLYIMAFLLGLGAANHQILITIAPAIALFVLIKNWRILTNINVWLISILLFLFGLSFYLYMPIRSAANPALDWGNTETSANFWKHVTRGVYFEPAQLADSFEEIDSKSISEQQKSARYTQLDELKDKIIAISKVTWLFLKNSLTQTNIIIGLLGWISFIFFFRKKQRQRFTFLLFFPLAIFVYIAIFWKLLDPRNPTTNFPFYIPITIFISLASIYPVFELTKKFRQAKTIITIVLLLLPISSLHQHISANNSRHNYVAYDVARNTLHFLPQNSILYISGDDGHILPIFYLQKTENFRTDVIVYDNIGNLFDAYPNWPGWDKVHAEHQNKRIFTQMPTESDRNFVYAHHTPFAIEMVAKDQYEPGPSLKSQKQASQTFNNPILKPRGSDDPNQARLMVEIAAHYYLLKGSANLNVDYPTSQKAFQKAVSMNGDKFWLNYFAAHIHNFQKFYPEAASYLDDASQILEQEGIFLYLESLYIKANNLEKAAETQKRRIEIFGPR